MNIQELEESKHQYETLSKRLQEINEYLKDRLHDDKQIYANRYILAERVQITLTLNKLKRIMNAQEIPSKKDDGQFTLTN